MSITKRRHGHVARVVAVLLTVVVGIPIAMIALAVLTYQTTPVQAQDGQPRLQEEVTPAPDIKAHLQAVRKADSKTFARPPFISDEPNQPADAPNALRPVYETVYDEQVVATYEPVVDPEKGTTRYTTRQQVIRTPRTAITWVAQSELAIHDEVVRELVKQLRDRKEEDAGRDTLMEKLREELDEEFTKMQESQAAQISQAEERLEKLKAMHNQRTDNREAIVQRRIDQLLGQPDPLQWNPRLMTAPQDIRPRLPIPSGSPIGVNRPPHLPLASPDAPPRIQGGRAATGSTRPIPEPDVDVFVAPQPPRPNLFPENEAPDSGPGNPATGTPRAVTVGPIDPRFNSSFATVEMKVSENMAVQSTPLGQMFEMFRTMADMQSDLKVAEREMERFERLKGNDAVANNEYNKLKNMVEKLRKSAALMNMQLEATATKLNQDLEAAEASVSHANEHFATVKTQVESGLAPGDRLSTARNELRKAENELRAAKMSLDQFYKARMLINVTEVEKVEIEEEVEEEAEK